MKALVIETAFPGDAIISLALARGLKSSVRDAEVTYLVRPDAASIVAASPDVDRVITFNKRGTESGIAGIENKAAELNALGFDRLYLLHSSRRSQELAKRLNIPTKIGFASATGAGLTRAVEDVGWSNRYERLALLLDGTRSGPNDKLLPRLVCDPPEIVRSFVKADGPLIALAPGSAWLTKKWGDARFAELAVMLVQRGAQIIVIGGSDASPAAELISKRCGAGSVLDLTRGLSMTSSAGAMSLASLVVANDSAPVHMAVALGVPVLAIFGPTVPAFGFAPPSGHGEVIEIYDLWCRPCASHGSNECPTHTHDCMTGIAPDGVARRALEMLIKHGE